MTRTQLAPEDDVEDSKTVEQAAPEAHVGTRRKDCWWEPIYAPRQQLDPLPYDWNLRRDSGPHNRFIHGSALQDVGNKGDVLKVNKTIFKGCDFQGDFRNGPFIRFDDCEFIKCDFAFSHWKDVQFRNCAFREASLSLSIFESCEFRDCSWDNIGVASKTDFIRTFINNPNHFISATVSRSNPTDRTVKHKLLQWYRLKGSRAHVLRNLLLSHHAVGDEHTFYETVRAHELARSYARVCQDLFEIAFASNRRVKAAFGLPFHIADHVILRIFGWLNDWGASAVKPFLALVGCFLAFGETYERYEFQSEIPEPWQKSFDLTLLIGYGNQVPKNDHSLILVQDIHVVCSIVIYTVFFATIISKLSRAR